MSVMATGVEPSWNVRWRQVAAIVGVEVTKGLFSRRSLLAYGLTLIPIALFTAMGFATDEWGEPFTRNIERARWMYSVLYAGFVLGVVVFFGSAAIFSSLFRMEVLDRSLHYYLLSPVRRELLVLAKYLAGLVASLSLFGLTTIVCYLLLYIPYGFNQFALDMAGGVAMAELFNYLGVTVLGCMGYGALFMFTGLVFRNPVVPVMVVVGWELMHFVLPPFLKMWSIAHYLKGLLPIPLDEGPLAVIATPPGTWTSIGGILLVVVVANWATAWLLSRHELDYARE